MVFDGPAASVWPGTAIFDSLTVGPTPCPGTAIFDWSTVGPTGGVAWIVSAGITIVSELAGGATGTVCSSNTMGPPSETTGPPLAGGVAWIVSAGITIVSELAGGATGTVCSSNTTGPPPAGGATGTVCSSITIGSRATDDAIAVMTAVSAAVGTVADRTPRPGAARRSSIRADTAALPALPCRRMTTGRERDGGR